jgi:hypothetical protein
MEDRLLKMIAKANTVQKQLVKKDNTGQLSERAKADSTIMEEVNSNWEEPDYEKELEKIKKIAQESSLRNTDGKLIEEKYTVEQIRNSKLPEPIKQAKIAAILKNQNSKPKTIIKEEKEISPKKNSIDIVDEIINSTNPKKNVNEDIKNVIKETVKDTIKEISSDLEDGTIKILIKNKILVCKVIKVQEAK